LTPAAFGAFHAEIVAKVGRCSRACPTAPTARLPRSTSARRCGLIPHSAIARIDDAQWLVRLFAREHLAEAKQL